MKTGKISETILKRSVLRQIRGQGKAVIKGAGVGEDCAFLCAGGCKEISCFAAHPPRASRGRKSPLLDSCCAGAPEGRMSAEPAGVLAVSTQTVALPVKRAAYLAVMAAANNLAAAGAVPLAVTLSLTLPAESEENLLKELMGQAAECCERLSLQIAGGHTEVSGNVKAPVVTATAVGEAGYGGRRVPEEMPQSREDAPWPRRDVPCSRREAVQSLEEARQSPKKGREAEAGPPKNLALVVSKWIGLEGTAVIAEEKEGELLGRFPGELVRAAKEQERFLSVAEEAAIAMESGVYAMHDVRGGGIFGALWEMSQRLGVGFQADLRKIPVRQETIEICEFYHLNPYELLSGGALLMAVEDGGRLTGMLKDAGIPCAVIGSTNGSNDKIITNREEIRYLGPPAGDEIYKIF